MSKTNYRFRLKVGSGSFEPCSPVWAAQTAVTTEQEKGQMFFRDKFTGTLTFVKQDFDKINGAAFDTEFRLLLQKQVGNIFQTVSPSMKFYKTDCKVNFHEKSIQLNTQESFDLYDQFLAALDKEFNLVELEPATTPITYKKQAVYQIYLPGASFVGNYSDGVWWETPCTPFPTTPDPGEVVTNDNHLTLLNDSGFGVKKNGALFDFAFAIIPGTGLSPDVSGIYSSGYNGVGLPALPMFRADDFYQIQTEAGSPGNVRITIREKDTSLLVYQTDEHPAPWSPFGQPPHSSPNVTFTSVTDPSSQVQAYLFAPYIRLLTNLTAVSGSPTVELDENDPIPHGAFTHALPVETPNVILSDGHSSDPTRWGKVSEDALFYGGQYFTKPTPGDGYIMPILGTTWTGASAWFYMDGDLRDLQQDASETITVNDAYKLSDVLKVLLPAAGANIGHDDGPTYSDFFYGTSNIVRGSRKVPVIVPISNILIGDYDQPASRAMIRLSEVFQLLERFHKVYPYIGEGFLKLEHYRFFDNGNSYTGEVIGTQLTGLFDPRTGKPVLFGQDVVSYEKQQLPERIEPGWLFEVSDPFEGFAIDVISNFVQKGNVQDGKITRFVSDIDFIHIYPEGTPNEGFVFIEAVEDGSGNLSVPFVDLTVSADETYRLQNGYASFIYAHDTYHRDGLPAHQVTLNKQTVSAVSVIRSKVQEVNVPDVGEIDPYQLVKTSIGNARIESIEKNLSSGGYKMILKHKTEN